MQKNFFSVFFFLFLFNSFLWGQKKEYYRIVVELNAFPDTICLLAHHYGDKKYVDDTAKVKNGKCIFAGVDTLPAGVYMVVLPPKNTYFEFIVSENDRFFRLKSDTTDFIEKMQIKGSLENKIFYDYVHFAARVGKNIADLQSELKNQKTKEDSARIQAKIKAEGQKLQNYKKELQRKFSSTFWAKVLRLMEEPEVPEAIEKNSQASFYYFKKHYWDNVDFSDSRLLRTPIFWNKVNFYLEKLTTPIPDSVIVSVEEILSRAKANPEMLKFFLVKLLNKYATNKVMGMDAVYVYIVKNYYEKGFASWLDSVQLYKIIDRAKRIEPNLLGKIGAEIYLPDSSGRYHSLHGVKAKYTILYIWDPDCGHCKKETPKLKKLYEELKNKDIEVYAVYGGLETSKWKEYIRTHKLEWINVHDDKFESDYRWKYDVFSTPTIYLLDENKKIVAKRLDVKQLGNYIKYLLEREKEKEK